MCCISTPPHNFTVCVRTNLSQVLLKELVGRNRTVHQYILWTVRSDVNVTIRGAHCYNWALKSQRIFSWVASSIHPPRITLSSFLKKPVKYFKSVTHTIFLKPSFSVSQTSRIVLPLRCTIVSNTIFIHWACREFPFYFMTSSINFHFSSYNTDDFSGRE